MAEWIQLIFGMKDSLGISYADLEGNLGISKNKTMYLLLRLSQTLEFGL